MSENNTTGPSSAEDPKPSTPPAVTEEYDEDETLVETDHGPTPRPEAPGSMGGDNGGG